MEEERDRGHPHQAGELDRRKEARSDRSAARAEMRAKIASTQGQGSLKYLHKWAVGKDYRKEFTEGSSVLLNEIVNAAVDVKNRKEVSVSDVMITKHHWTSEDGQKYLTKGMSEAVRKHLN